jgi:hypothetical protein
MINKNYEEKPGTSETIIDILEKYLSIGPEKSIVKIILAYYSIIDLLYHEQQICVEDRFKLELLLVRELMVDIQNESDPLKYHLSKPIVWNIQPYYVGQGFEWLEHVVQLFLVDMTTDEKEGKDKKKINIDTCNFYNTKRISARDADLSGWCH